MRFYTFQAEERRTIGLELGEQLIDLPVAYAALLRRKAPEAGPLPALPADMLQFVRLGDPPITAAREVLEFMKKRPAAPVGSQLAYTKDAVKILAPIRGSERIISTRMDSNEPPDTYDYIFKLPNTVIGHEEKIVVPKGGEQVLGGAELGMVIGRRIKAAAVEDLSCIFGVTLANNVRLRSAKQPLLGANHDSFFPMGPAIATLDELTAFQLKAFSGVPRLLTFLAGIMTLDAGDVVTFDCSGVHVLQPGAPSTIEIPGIGFLSNRVVMEK